LGSVTQCTAQAAVNVTDGLGAEFAAADAASTKQLAVKFV
jgi:hypothetical protein